MRRARVIERLHPAVVLRFVGVPVTAGIVGGRIGGIGFFAVVFGCGRDWGEGGGVALISLEGDDRLGRPPEVCRREPRHRRRPAAEESDMAEPVALQRDRAAAVAPGLHRLAEGRCNVAKPGLQAVADATQRVHPGIGRGVRLGMADDHRRRVGGGVPRDDPVQPVLVETHGAACHVAPGPGPADVDPPVERAHLAPLCVGVL